MSATKDILDIEDDENNSIDLIDLLKGILIAVLVAFLFQRMNDFVWFHVFGFRRYSVGNIFYLIGLYLILRFLFRFILIKDKTIPFIWFLFIAILVFGSTELLRGLYHSLIYPINDINRILNLSLISAIFLLPFMTGGLMIDLKKGRPILGVLFTIGSIIISFFLLGFIVLAFFGMG